MTESNDIPCIEINSSGGARQLSLADFIDSLGRDETVGMEAVKLFER